MKKEELIERIIDSFTDMGSEAPEDTATCDFIDEKEAEMYLNEYRAMEQNFSESERLPADVTPQMYMEAWNCYVRKCRHDVQVERLAEFIRDRELVVLYLDYIGTYRSESDRLVYPTDFLNEDMEFPFTETNLTMLDLIVIGQRSPEFNPDDGYCRYDEKTNQMFSTDTPIEDGWIDAKAFAEWILEDNDRKEYVIDTYMDNTDVDYIFREEIENDHCNS